MFITKKRTKNNPNIYVQLVESYRNKDGKVRQRVIKHVGSAPTEEHLEKIIELAHTIKAMINDNISEQTINVYHQKELSKITGARTLLLNARATRKTIAGTMEVYGKIFDEMQLDTLIKSRSNYSEILKDIVIGRIACFGSKKRICEQLSAQFNKTHPLNAIYRTMDKIDDAMIASIQSRISDYNVKLQSGGIKVLFFDATTLYFESFQDDELRKLGYSKDCKFNQPQLVLTMLVSEQGLPLGYQIFPGNTYEGGTLMRAMRHWKEQYPAQPITLVADSGMLNKINLEHLEKAGFNYIVCARLKNLNKPLKQAVLSGKKQTAEDYFYDLAMGDRRLVVSYRHCRAIKDRHDREKAIGQLSQKLSGSKSPAHLISNYGYKKYISINEQSEVNLNQEKILEAQQWDGLHGLVTNLNDVSSKDIYAQYYGLWQIEEAFRVNKTDLQLRPVFHWTPRRIKAHIALSYIAYCCYRAVSFKVNQKLPVKLSHRKIREILSEVQYTIFEDKQTKAQFYMPLPTPDYAREIYQVMGLALEEEPCSYVA